MTTAETPAPAEAQQEKALTVQAKAKSVKAFIDQNVGAIREALPKLGISPESVAKAALMQCYRNPKLLDCDRTSLMRSIVESAQLGLTFTLGRAYLVPYNNKVKGYNGKPDSWRLEAQLIPGYLGLLDIARRSGEIKEVVVECVYKGDEFDYARGLEKDTFHHKSLVEPDDAKLTHAYAIIRLKDGGYQFGVMTKSQIEKIRAKSKQPNSGPWVDHYPAMCKKTVLKQVIKFAPASVELQRAVELDNAAEAGEAQVISVDFATGLVMEEHPEEQPATTTSTVKDKVRAARKTAGKVIDVTPTTQMDDTERKWRDATVISVREAMLALRDGNEAEAAVALSEATGGKVQGFIALWDALTPDMAKQIQVWISAEDKRMSSEEEQ